MTKSATELMQEILAAAAIDAVMAMKAASGGLPNSLLRDINAVHANTTFADLPQPVQDSIAANVRTAFTKLLKEGYSIAPSSGQDRGPPRAPSPGGQGPRPRPQGGPGAPRRPDGSPPANRPRRPRTPRG